MSTAVVAAASPVERPAAKTLSGSIGRPVSDRIREDLDAGLTRGERVRLGLRIGTALAAGVLLAAAVAIDWVFPTEQQPIAACLKALAAILVLLPILREAAAGLFTAEPDAYSSQLVALASLAALSVGDFATAALIPIILSVAFFLEERSILGAQAAIEGLKQLQARKARRQQADGTTLEVPVEQIAVGDTIVVHPGETIPADGTVLAGRSAVDQSTITGESVPEDVGPGSGVFAGTINQNGLIQVEVASAADESTLGRVLDLLREAERSKTDMLRLIERYAKYLVFAVLLIAGITLFLSRDLSRAIAVLVVGCPGPFILAGPAAMVAALAAASRNGILVKNAKFLETMTEVDSVIFDKTGTVTQGRLRVAGLAPADGSERDLIEAAAVCGRASQHPVSRAIADHGGEVLDQPLPEIVRADEESGRGVIAETTTGRLWLGRRTWLADQGFTVPEEPEHTGPIVWSAVEDDAGKRCLGAVLLADEVRPDAADVVEDLGRLGVERVTLLTGDRRPVAQHIAGRLGVGNVVAEVLPAHKLDVVRAERNAGYRVMVVGDGVNDAPALAGGDLGVAMGANGAEIALRSADLVLMTERLDRIPFAMRLARRTRTTIHRNVIGGAGLTMVMLGLASAGLISPIAGAILQNVGELFVILNSATLLKTGWTPETAPGTHTATPGGGG
ncbi:MAG: cation-translocating P-type ATPase [Planctomycetota bacterium]